MRVIISFPFLIYLEIARARARANGPFISVVNLISALYLIPDLAAIPRL